MHGIPLRVGCVPIRALYDAGAWLKVAKLNLSPKTAQAMLQGTACSLAEQWLKQNDARLLRSEATGGDADLEGLQCRWQPITNRHGMILSLLVRVLPTHATQAWTIYQEIITSISAIYPDDASASPAHTGGMSISLAPTNLMKEARVHNGKNIVGQWLYFLRIFCISMVGRISFGYGLKLGNFDGKRYLQELVTNSDTRKFDEMLRMVLDSTAEQRAALETMLQVRQQKGEIAYGIHASSQALMTCLVFNHEGNHIHFVDGADGGYALAAKQMKQQLVHA